jgi:hypothetical protein
MKVAIKQYQDNFERMGETVAVEYVQKQLGGPALDNMDQFLE